MSEEVDLTGADTPPKKMKQSRLPFAPLNKLSSKAAPAGKVQETGRKRKNSNSEDENLTPNKKSAKIDTKPKDKDSIAESIKAKLSVFAANTDQSYDVKKVEDTNKEVKEKTVKPRVEPEEPEIEDIPKKEKDSNKFSGLLHGLMKKKKPKCKDKEGNVDKQDEESVDDFELVLESSVEEQSVNDGEDASINSMTDEWAKFHENNDTDQSMEVNN